MDPFAGGGSIPLEALRVGADAFASDLNPVAVLLNRVVLEYIPKYGHKLVKEVDRWGKRIQKQAEKELSRFYPKDPDGSMPIAYLWARTIRCEGPRCGVEIPLMRSLWVAKTKRLSVALRMIPKSREKRIDFEIINNAELSEVCNGTVRRASATCPCCGYTTPPSSLREQLKARQGGVSDARLLVVVTMRNGQKGRSFRLGEERDLVIIRQAAAELERRKLASAESFSIFPDEPLPLMSGVFNAPIYGHTTWGSLFNPRQALMLCVFARLIRDAGQNLARSDQDLAIAVVACLSLVFDKVAEKATSLSRYDSGAKMSGIIGIFSGQRIPMVWDFGEGNPLLERSSGWLNCLEWHLKVLNNCCKFSSNLGISIMASATSHPMPNDSTHCFFTDPPYYNAVPYADLSDFFYVWLKRNIGDRIPELFQETLSPKEDEICEMASWDAIRYPHKDGLWFEKKMTKAMAEGRRMLAPGGVGVVVFAHKSTRGWEAQIQAMIDAGWTVTGSWPIDTEMGTRLRAHNSAVLGSSIHIVCRPRENPDGSLRADDIGDWRDVLQELPQRIHEWMPRLAIEGVVGADAIFACLGPALEIFSRYSRVEKASGEQVTLKEYLEHVWAAVAKEALNMIFEGADATGFEEDARLTAMWLWTISTGGNGGRNGEGEAVASTGYVLEYDAARKIAQGLGAHLERLSHLVEIKGDKARLLPVSERSHYLFGKKSAQVPKSKRGKKDKQMKLGFMTAIEEAKEQAGLDERFVPSEGKTVLDRLHQSMLLFASGRGEALKRFLVEEGVGRDQRFWRLAQALSALYPANVDEKRWVDGVLARKKGLGF